MNSEESSIGNKPIIQDQLATRYHQSAQPKPAGSPISGPCQDARKMPKWGDTRRPPAEPIF